MTFFMLMCMKIYASIFVAVDGTLNSQGTIAELMNRLEFRDSNSLFMDITPKGSIVKTLQKSKIDCLVREKDLYMYYFITRYPSRTLVFVNNAVKTKIKKFESQNLNAVMVASDMAAQRLNILLIKYVIHYQLPHSGD
ncbi:19124_t:CDS:2, partial [Racocetra persica]